MLIPEFQENQLKKCPSSLPELTKGADLGQILMVYVQTADTYHECKATHNNLVDTIKRLK